MEAAPRLRRWQHPPGQGGQDYLVSRVAIALMVDENDDPEQVRQQRMADRRHANGFRVEVCVGDPKGHPDRERDVEKISEVGWRVGVKVDPGAMRPIDARIAA